MSRNAVLKYLPQSRNADMQYNPKAKLVINSVFIQKFPSGKNNPGISRWIEKS